MAYEIHITGLEPDGRSVPVQLSEWHAAVNQTPNVRLAEGDWEIANPKTGEVIRIPNTGGDAELLRSEGGEWRRVLNIAIPMRRGRPNPATEQRRLTDVLC